jgi:mitochondrial fission protein ELM1
MLVPALVEVKPNLYVLVLAATEAIVQVADETEPSDLTSTAVSVFKLQPPEASLMFEIRISSTLNADPVL